VARLALALLGPFQATLDGLSAGGLSSDHLRALLAYLAVESGREHPREVLASLLWPERPDREALSALRYALSNLHGALGDRRTPSPFLLVTRASVQFNAASDHWLDVAEFESLAGRTDVPGLEWAASLYRGPFLHGLSVRDSPAFDDWLLLKDEEYQRSVLSVLGHLTSLRLAHEDYREAARWARRQLELEPYREQAHRQLMAALARDGERSAALVHYEACHRMLAEELGCEPEDETQALYAQIRDGALPRPQPHLSVPPAPRLPVSIGAQPAPRFVARERELARLHAFLDRALAGGGGVALIAGEAGSGKTALLDEFARQAGQVHGDLIVLRGRCNAHAGAGDPHLPFREIMQTLAGDVESKRAGGTLPAEQARRAWDALPAVSAALVEHGPDLIDRFVPGEALLRRAEGFPALAMPVRWQARLREMVRRAGEGVAPLSGPGAGLGAPGPQPDLFAQVTQVLHTVAAGSPLFLAIDDLQWADGGTVALLFHLARRLAGSRILLACAYRPEELGAGEGGQATGSDVWAVIRELHREWGDVLIDLNQADGRTFVEACVDSEPNRLGAGFRQALYDHTGGNPLFTVELLRSFEHEGALVQDEGGRWVEAPTLDWAHWPPQVEAVIAGHMAALPEEDRALLQVASVQGERFAAEVAARVLGWGEEAVVRRLSGPLRTRHRLVHAVSLDRLPSSGQRLSHYGFRHALLQRSAYGSLDAVERARLHEATGRALEVMYALPAGQPTGAQAAEGPAQALAPELARHFEVAGLPLEASRYRLEAGRWATRLVAHEEAIAHLERGLALLEGVTASRERLRLEVSLWVAMVTPALLQGGWRAPTFTRALERLSDLSQHPDLQGDPQRLVALTLLAMMNTWSADPERGRRVGEQFLGLAHDDDLQSLLLAHWVLGHSHFGQGQLVAAREHLDQALALLDPEAGRPLGPTLGADPGVMGRVMLGFVLWVLGYADQGRASLQQALTRAHAIEQPATVAFVHVTEGLLHFILGRDAASAQRLGAAVQSLGLPALFYGDFVEVLAAQDGHEGAGGPKPGPEQDAGRATEAGSALPGVGFGVGQAAYWLIQAQMCIWAGQAEMGLQAMDRTLAWIEQTGVRPLEAEVWRMRGELLLADGPDRSARPPRTACGGPPATLCGMPVRSRVEEADACLRRALGIARGQEARWLELRAAVSLARLCQRQGRRDEARDLLAGVYGWFTEGFDTVDLVEAKALLEELR